MGLEIEKKFLVHKELWDLVPRTVTESIQQVYLLNEPERTIRIRLTDTEGYLTIKGAVKGISRTEYEYKIPASEAREMIEALSLPVVSKIRHKVVYMGKTWEVDEFTGNNAGLIVAEIELETEDEAFELPPWAGREVTGDDKYYNSSLSQVPFRDWQTVNM